MTAETDLPDLGESALAAAIRTGAALARPHPHPDKQGLPYVLVPPGYEVQKLPPRSPPSTHPAPPRSSGTSPRSSTR